MPSLSSFELSLGRVLHPLPYLIPHLIGATTYRRREEEEEEEEGRTP